MTDQEIELIAALTENGGYKLLLSRVEAEIDTLEDKIEECGSQFEQNKVLAVWRATKKLFRMLKYTPQNFSAALDELVGEKSPAIEPMDIESYKKALEWAAREQQLHLELLNDENELE